MAETNLKSMHNTRFAFHIWQRRILDGSGQHNRFASTVKADSLQVPLHKSCTRMGKTTKVLIRTENKSLTSKYTTQLGANAKRTLVANPPGKNELSTHTNKSSHFTEKRDKAETQIKVLHQKSATQVRANAKRTLVLLDNKPNTMADTKVYCSKPHNF